MCDAYNQNQGGKRFFKTGRQMRKREMMRKRDESGRKS
jgi:hypothetical protein